MASYFCSPNYSRKISVSILQKILQDAVHGHPPVPVNDMNIITYR